MTQVGSFYYIKNTESQFDQIATRAELEATKFRLPITFYRNRERNGKYLFLEPNGEAVVIKNGDEEGIGNFFDDYENVLRNWHEFVDPGLLWKNVIQTYPGVKNA